MGLVRIVRVISYSSQDGYFKAENLIRPPQPCDLPQPWLCAKDDKSGRLVGEFELEGLSCISFIDIGNFGSAIVEIQVCRSDQTDYQTLLPAVTLLSAVNVKRNEENTGVYMFNNDNIDTEVAAEEWNRIRIICSQPFKKMQFGIQFIEFRSRDSDIPSWVENNPKEISHFPSEARTYKMTTKSALSRGLQMVNASQAKSAPTVLMRNEAVTAFLREVEIFLVGSMNVDGITNSPKESLRDFEKRRGVNVTNIEKRIFIHKYFHVLHKINQSVDVYLKKYKGVDIQSSNDEIPSSTQSKRADPMIIDLQADITQLSTSKDFNGSQPSTSKDFNEGQSSTFNGFDRTQPSTSSGFDGTQPSTSKGFDLIDCPICGETFSRYIIEKHCATCGLEETEGEFKVNIQPEETEGSFSEQDLALQEEEQDLALQEEEQEEMELSRSPFLSSSEDQLFYNRCVKMFNRIQNSCCSSLEDSQEISAEFFMDEFPSAIQSKRAEQLKNDSQLDTNQPSILKGLNGTHLSTLEGLNETDLSTFSGFDGTQPLTSSGFDGTQPSTSSGFDETQSSTSSNFDETQPSTHSSFDETQPSTSSGFDATQPSTFKGFSLVKCPICGDKFSELIIEKHAATCRDISILRAIEREQERSSDDEGILTCPVCGDTYPESEINKHLYGCTFKM